VSGHADLVTVDDADDRERASDGVSRYGFYLRDRAGQFSEGGEPIDPEWHATLVWRIATGPIMAPGYVQVRSDLGGVTLRRAEEEPGLLVADVEVPVDWPDGMRQALGRDWQSWDTERELGGDRELRYPPRRQEVPALLLTASVQVPIPMGGLPARRVRRGVDTGDAKRVVQAVCRRVNEVAGPAVAALREAL
jgi:hypothetical protein